MGMRGNVRIVTKCFLPHIEFAHNTDLTERIERFVDRSEAHRRIVRAQFLIERLCRRVLIGRRKCGIDSKTLRRHLFLVLPQNVRNLSQCQHHLFTHNRSYSSFFQN